MIDLLRIYDPETCGADGYPFEWHASIKGLIRRLADFRCERCKHPYRAGDPGTVGPRGEWSRCDERCDHEGPVVWDQGDPAAGIPAQIDEEVVWAHWRILTVHHLDGNKWNCLWWNLVALCQRCHLQIQGKVRMAQVYPFEHFEWFKPYAAGYYALTYLGEELGREETLARIDELLALELVS